jgi:hypothetical protein
VQVQFEIQSRITQKVEVLEFFGPHIHSSQVIVNKNELSKYFSSKLTLFSIAGSSDCVRGRGDLYMRSTSHEKSECVIESQKFFAPLFLLLLRKKSSKDK